MVVHDKNLLLLPQPLQTDPKNHEPNKYYQFHPLHGYDTNSYIHLKTEIERIIKGVT